MYFKQWFPYLLYVWTQCEYLGLTANSNAPFCFDRIECLDFFGPGGLFHHNWRELLRYNLVFAFGYNFRNDKCHYLFSFTHLLLVFSILLFDVRRYNSTYLSCAYVPCPVKFTMFTEESVRKSKWISSTNGSYTFLL